MHKPDVTESSGNVFRDLGFSEEDARESLAKAKLVCIIQRTMESAGWTQERTAKIIGVKQPRLSTMLRGDYRNISEAKLLDCVMKLGCDVKIIIKRRSARTIKSGRQGQLEIVSA
ncbi:MAG: helix-turn-helix domain-containing protein [Planctomycetota bacterium]|jgi:predicted XRE-type DNA-binding protein|nr:helix-turn-helix domain-containing protein [Planctomycetota bacterium]